jgi:probable HAF family extracellular repeat protein
MNDRTEVVGFSEIHPGSPVIRAFLWTEAAGMRSLGTLGGESSVANGVNNRREVVGGSDTWFGNNRAYLWTPARGMRNLGTLGGKNSEAIDLNDATQVVGYSETSDGSSHAFLWSPGRGMEDLGTLGGANSLAWGISELGAIVGQSETAGGRKVAFLWTRERGMRSLGTLPRLPGSFAAGVNTHQRVIGYGFSDETTVPFLWIPGSGMQPLPTLGGPGGVAEELNEFGQIAGAITAADGVSHATLWTPTAGPLAVSEPNPGR